MAKAKKTTSRKTNSKRKTSTKKKAKKRSFKSYIIRLGLLAIGSALVGIGLLFSTVYLGFWGKLPDYYTLRNIKNADASEIYSEDGAILGRVYAENRTNVNFKDISPNVINSLIATEDARFYEHQGVDQRSMLRVLVKSLIMRDRSSGGGSTLSQQLAKNLYPRKRFGALTMPVNKIREAITASRLEKIYSKKEILQLYLNTVSFGENVFGIESASRQFFSKPASALKTHECAVLIGMLKAPTYYNPRLHPERSKQRRNVVLNQMAKYEYISEVQSKQLKALPLGLRYNNQASKSGLAPYLREKIRIEANKILADFPKDDGSYYDIYRDGLKITTTLDSKLQAYAEQSVSEHLKRLQDLFYKHWGSSKPWDNKKDILTDAKRRSDRYKKLKKTGKSEQEINKIFNKKIDMKIFTWSGEKEVNMSPNDSIKHYVQLLNTGFLAMEPHSGKIKAWVGGIDFNHFKYDHVTAKRQVGSVFKPVVFSAALEEGVSPFVYLPNERKVYEEYDNWSPRNADNKYEGSYSMEGALAESVNTIAVDVLLQTGIRDAIVLAEEMGVDSNLPKVPSLALGTANISLFEMIQVYATLANRGVHVDPYYLVKIEDKNGNLIADLSKQRDENRFVLSPQNADIINHMLQAVVNSGTGKTLRNVYKLEGDLAGKTGTTNSHADGWYIGYNSNLVAGAWVGADDMRVHFRSLTLGQGASMALPIYGKFMHKLSRNRKFSNYSYASIRKPDSDILAQLSIPHYMPKDSGFLKNIFGVKAKDRDKLMERKARRAKRKAEKKSIYQRIKNIFKKKNKD
ncbi:penicillin-binding protein 1A [Marinifilum sp. D737]|uniref:penicillin-binding protein 1A n=1 Tax=Marinifilum sp. D737 TaxID=2969628 RepID=UPI0022765D4F|nr:transglycosylase domain-containing protein [Marinifilum sp. D737]MCY1633615.1 transglycosylase domain-containing protein [Marinifilum sp. D737]